MHHGRSQIAHDRHRAINPRDLSQGALGMIRVNDSSNRSPSMSQQCKACLSCEGRQTTVLKQQHRHLFKPLRTVVVHSNSMTKTTRANQNSSAHSSSRV
jgi:RecB family endonuclease NucS